jgi:putative OPT family oligopeptide transporter
MTPSSSKPVEITARGVILGILITLVFTASQVYMGLKVSLTFATSIPAAVISMALLRFFKTATIQENNIVQTIASSAGTLSSVVFTLPGLLILGWWTKVPFLTTFLACTIGGVLGVMYTMPLRRALVTNSDLPYPEGTAAAEVLKVGTSSREGRAEGTAGLWAVIWGGLTSAIYAAAAVSTWMAGEISAYFKVGSAKGTAATGMAGSSSLALIGAGHLMGITVGVAMFMGLFIAWGVCMPILTTIHPHPEQVFADAAARTGFIRGHEIRFIGAGVIGVAALWAIGKLILPVWQGLMSALEAQRKRKSGEIDLPRSEHDLPVWIVGLVVVVSMVPAGWLLSSFIGAGSALAPVAMPLIIAGVAYIIIAGLLAAAVCGYMAGLIGASNSPVSGVAILAVLGLAVIVGIIGHQLTGDNAQQALVAFCMMVVTVVLAVAVIGNDNLQDLKTGQLVDATPWKQQVALIIGVVAGAAVIPPVLDMMHNVYGFVGEVGHHPLKPNAEIDPAQAGLISTLAKGAIGGQLPLGLLGTGALIGAVLVAIDEGLRAATKGRLALPPLGVGLAVYLPPAVTSPVVIGAVAGWIFEKLIARRKSKEIASRLSVLVASGFIVGESLLNVLYALLVSATRDPDIISRHVTPLAKPWDMIVALGAALVIMIWLYIWAAGKGKKIEDDA